jgi:protein SCO1
MRSVTMFKVLKTFIQSWRFPVTTAAFLLSMVMLMTSVLLIPQSGTSLSGFAEDFKIWCFGYNPDTGTLEWGYIWMFLVQPFVLLGLIAIIWLNPIRRIIRENPRAMLPYILAAFLVTGGMALTFPSTGNRAVESVPLFPGQAIRTQRFAPELSLADQNGMQFNLTQERGNVVLITAVYASCGDTCPLILSQTRRVLMKLSPKEVGALNVVAVTLDPERDTPVVLRNLLRAYSMDSLGVRALTGSVDSVNSVLDRFGFSRIRDPETGMIEHANKLIVIDKQGRIAYTFALSRVQEQWLETALHELIAES